MDWTKLRWLRQQLLALAALPADVAELARSVRDARTAAEATLAYVQRPREQWAQLLLLWTVPPRPPRVLAGRKPGVTRGIDPEEVGASGGLVHTEEREPLPGFHSISFDLNDPELSHRGVCSEPFQTPVPAGAWLVASGCMVSQVFVGTQLQDVGSGIKGLPVRVLRLTDAIGVGVYLRAAVVNPERGR
jgi:hypothetical protein